MSPCGVASNVTHKDAKSAALWVSDAAGFMLINSVGNIARIEEQEAEFRRILNVIIEEELE